MYKNNPRNTTDIDFNTHEKAETLEEKIERFIYGGESMDDQVAPMIYTERKDGVGAGYNVRTDRFEVAVEAMDKVNKSRVATSENKHLKVVKDNDETKKEMNNGTEE